GGRARAGADGLAGAPVDAWWRAASGPAPTKSAQSERIRFGPRWRCVARAGYADGVAVAELQLPAPFAGDLAAHALHPALLDMALGAALPLLGEQTGDTLYVPVGCDAVEVGARLPARAGARA